VGSIADLSDRCRIRIPQSKREFWLAAFSSLSSAFFSIYSPVPCQWRLNPTVSDSLFEANTSDCLDWANMPRTDAHSAVGKCPRPTTISMFDDCRAELKACFALIVALLMFDTDAVMTTKET
jgi:hypothetical protein